MPLVEITKDQAAARLKAGPLAIGESHDNGAARDFLIDLIDQDLVKVLFLEAIGNQGHYMEVALSKAIQANQGGLGKDAVKSYLTPLDSTLSPDNPIPFSKLIWKAMKHKARVVFSDISIARAASATGMHKRNAIVDAIFNEASFMSGNPARAGCVILFGAEHFKSSDPRLKRMIGEDIPLTLPWVDLS